MSSVSIKLPEAWSRFLLTQPENGMGYQRVDVWLEGDRELRDVVVFNAETIEMPAELAAAEIRNLRLHRPPPGA